jgi:hypothetical protein
MDDQNQDGPLGLREHKDQLLEELKTERSEKAALFAENVQYKVQAIGLDPSAGVGKSIVKDIVRGDYTGEISQSALAAYAQSEYGETVSPSQPKQVTEDENRLSQAQDQLDAIQQLGSETTPLTKPVDVIGELQAEMLRRDATPDEVDRAVKASITLKGRQLQEDFRAGKITTTPEP